MAVTAAAASEQDRIARIARRLCNRRITQYVENGWGNCAFKSNSTGVNTEKGIG